MTTVRDEPHAVAVPAVPRFRTTTLPTPPPSISDTTDLGCSDFVEQVTEYLESALETAEPQRIEEHLAGCDGCTDYLHQIRETVTALRALNEAGNSITRGRMRATTSKRRMGSASKGNEDDR